MTSSDRARDVEIAALALLGRPTPDVLGDLLEVARLATGAGSARLNLVSSRHQHVLLDADGAEGTHDAEQSLCLRVVQGPTRTVLVPDAREDGRFAGLDFVTSGAVVGYAASQLVTSAGTAIGTLCVFDSSPQHWDERTRRTLESLAVAVSGVLEADRSREVLGDSLVQLVRDSRELRRANRHLASFAGQVSHDLMGPLSAVSLALALAQEGLEESADGGAGLPGLLGRAVAATARAQATVGGLLELAGLGSGVRRERVAGADLVDEALFDLSAHRGGTTVVVDELPALLGDPVQLRAVVQNYLGNAFKHAARPGGCVLVDGVHRGDTVRLQVHDSGPGVPEELREQVFDRGTRGEAARQAGLEGQGIGLDTCRRIAEAHDGRVGVETSSRLGGACFWLEVPAPEVGRGQLPESLVGEVPPPLDAIRDITPG